MPSDRSMNFWVGAFMIAGLASLAVLAFKVSGLTTYFGGNSYVLTADFDNIGSLRVRAPVTIAGVKVGEVANIQLNRDSFQAKVTLRIKQIRNDLPEDTTASILTEGLLGSNYISLSPGYQETYLANGDQITETHPALILENLVGQLLYNTKSKAEKADNKKT